MTEQNAGTVCGNDPDAELSGHDAEVVSRFRDFLAVVGPPRTPAEIEQGLYVASPARRYHVGIMAWKVSYAAETGYVEHPFYCDNCLATHPPSAECPL